MSAKCDASAESSSNNVRRSRSVERIRLKQSGRRPRDVSREIEHSLARLSYVMLLKRSPSHERQPAAPVEADADAESESRTHESDPSLPSQRDQKRESDSVSGTKTPESESEPSLSSQKDQNEESGAVTESKTRESDPSLSSQHEQQKEGPESESPVRAEQSDIREVAAAIHPISTAAFRNRPSRASRVITRHSHSLKKRSNSPHNVKDDEQQVSDSELASGPRERSSGPLRRSRSRSRSRAPSPQSNRSYKKLSSGNSRSGRQVRASQRLPTDEEDVTPQTDEL